MLLVTLLNTIVQYNTTYMTNNSRQEDRSGFGDSNFSQVLVAISITTTSVKTSLDLIVPGTIVSPSAQPPLFKRAIHYFLFGRKGLNTYRFYWYKSTLQQSFAYTFFQIQRMVLGYVVHLSNMQCAMLNYFWINIIYLHIWIAFWLLLARIIVNV